VNLTPATPSGSYALTIPAIAGADTLATLGLAQTFSGKITFTPTATIAGLNVGSYAGNPSSPVNGDLWYNSTGNALNAQINGATVSLGAGGGCSNNCTISSTAVGTVPLTIAGFSSGQTADLLDLYDYGTHTKVFSVAHDGSLSGTVYYGTLYGGYITATQKITVQNYFTGGPCISSASPASCGFNAAGFVVIAAGASSVQVNFGGTGLMNANSQVFLQSDDSLGTALSVTCNTAVAGTLAPYISARSTTSFTISTSATVTTNPACISYHMMN
jgi:hypothetical protein